MSKKSVKKTNRNVKSTKRGQAVVRSTKNFKEEALKSLRKNEKLKELHRKPSNVVQAGTAVAIAAATAAENRVRAKKRIGPFEQLLINYDERVKIKESAISDSDDDDDDDDNNQADNNSTLPQPETDIIEPLLDVAAAAEAEDEETIEADLKNENDPFSKHFFYSVSDSHLESLQNKKNVVKDEIKWAQLGHIFVKRIIVRESEKRKRKLLDREWRFAECGSLPEPILNFRLADEQHTNRLFVKRTLLTKLRAANSVRSTTDGNLLTDFQLELFSILNNYQDLYYPQETFANSNEIRTVYCLHILNHVLKSRAIITYHNCIFEENRIDPIRDEIGDEYRDQGLVRPKVLVLVPFRNSAYEIVRKLIDLFVPGRRGQVDHRKKFVRHYTSGAVRYPRKPDDYQQTFRGSIDDNFKLGLAITNKSIKLFVDLYAADIIIASPLAIRLLIGEKGESKRDFDFLASIELLVLDQTELFLVQNFNHLVTVLETLHMHPRKEHGINMNRVRYWALNGLAKYYRQTLVFGAVREPKIDMIFEQFANNYAGKCRVLNGCENGAISQTILPLEQQVFHRVYTDSLRNMRNDRLNYFTNQILPNFAHNMFSSHCLIYVADQVDFFSLYTHFGNNDLDFLTIHENMKDGDIAEARDKFFHGHKSVLLYSERFHFLRRIKVKGVRHLIFYNVPTFPHFYAELCNSIECDSSDSDANSPLRVTVLYTKYDRSMLERIIGTRKCNKILNSDQNIGFVR